MIADSPNGRITYRGEMPPEIRATLIPLFEKYKALIPDWCGQVNVYYCLQEPTDHEAGAAADATSDYEYREATLRIYPRFFLTHQDQRERYVVHELMHIAVNPLYNFAVKTFRRFAEAELKNNGWIGDIVLGELGERVESVTSDLERIVIGLTKENIMAKAHPGFKKVSESIEKKEGVSKESADAILAASSRKASAGAKKANPNLKKVKGGY